MNRMQKKVNNFFMILILFSLVASCKESRVPKPRGFFRIDLPDKQYIKYDTICPFTFEYPVYGRISYDLETQSEPCWFNIVFPGYKAKIYVSYKRIKNDLESILKESYDLAYSHSVKADAIEELPYQNSERKVYGILFNIKGNTASSVQFFVTDSTRNYLRGALYFSSQPREDSLAPVISFFREDMIHMVETLEWK